MHCQEGQAARSVLSYVALAEECTLHTTCSVHTCNLLRPTVDVVCAERSCVSWCHEQRYLRDCLRLQCGFQKRPGPAPAREHAGEPEAFTPELVGFGMVSFSQASRNITLTMNAPADQPFLTNMAVGEAFQRQGIATLLLQACEAETRQRCPKSKLFLQARQRDAPAIALYECGSGIGTGICVPVVHALQGEPTSHACTRSQYQHSSLSEHLHALCEQRISRQISNKNFDASAGSMGMR